MAKKKKAKVVKMKPKAKAAKKPSNVAARMKQAAKSIRKSLRQPALPGTEQIRNRALDQCCEGISDTRAAMSTARGEEQDLTRRAVQVMQRDKVQAYRHAGVEMVLVPGDVKLRVRTVKDTANADASPEDAEDQADEAGVIADEINDDLEPVRDVDESEGDEDNS